MRQLQPMTARDFLQLVYYELDRSRAKYPGNENRFDALAYEFGEVMVECQLLRGQRPGASCENLRTELVQLAAMALRLAVEGDPRLGTDAKSEPV